MQPAWFRISPRFLKGVEYLCNVGFTRAPAPALSEVQESAEEQEPARKTGATSGTGTAESIVVCCLLSQIDRLLAGPCEEACAELASLTLPLDAQAHEPAPMFSFNLANDCEDDGSSSLNDAPDECPDVVAEEEDGDDFVFESLEPVGASESGFLASLLPSEPAPSTVSMHGGTRGGRGWEDGAQCLCKLAYIAKAVSYGRVANHWGSLDVAPTVMRIIGRLLDLPPQLW